MTTEELDRLKKLAEQAINTEVVFLRPDVVLTLIAEIKRLKKWETALKDMSLVSGENETLRAQLAEAREVIEYYSDLDNLNRTRYETGMVSGHKYEIWEMDSGPAKARDYLEKI